MPHVAANIGNLFGVDGIIILAIGLLIFGRRLPEVERNLAASIMRVREFRVRWSMDLLIVGGVVLYVVALLIAYCMSRRGW